MRSEKAVRFLRCTGWTIPFGVMAAALVSAGPSVQSKPKIDFAKEIAPVLKAKCGICHGPDVQSAGMRLDTLDGVKKGGASGSLWVPGRSGESLIVQRLTGQGGKPRMPMSFGPLPEAFIAKVKSWIDQGASFGDSRAQKHWAYLRPKRPTLPPVKTKGWARNPVDLFVLARLEKEGLKPSREASKETLCRRLYLDLIGLPPSVEELDAFLNDKRHDAYERLVDRLLSNPHYGEKMALGWLDLARYADTNGYEKDLPRQMWLWRDWVIDAFNKNAPYDRFTVEQLAGDLLPKPTQDQLIATGFHRNSMLNDEGGIDPEEFRVIAVMDRVDATAVAWLGTTLACAQCHDHKYDPFPQRDFYRFYAFFNQTADNGRDMDPLLKVPSPEQKKDLERLEGELSKSRQEQLARTPTALAQLPSWERQFREGWRVLQPSEWRAQANLKLLSDGSLLASGPDPVQDEYTVTYPLSAGSISGLRIEAVPDPSLPNGGSGRNFNGNFVLRRVEAKVVRRDGIEDGAKFDLAKADFTQGGHDPMSVIRDVEGEGWAIAGFLPEQRVLHTLNLRLKSPVSGRDGDRMVVRYIHQSKHPNHNLGRFRLSATSDPELAGQSPPGGKVRDVLAKDSANRTAEDRKTLEDFYLSVAPDLLEIGAQLSLLQKQRDELEAKIPTTMVLRQADKPRVDLLLKRGDFRTPGYPLTPGVPRALGSWAPTSDRMGLAKWLASPNNPLTARVAVNRLWEQCFGRGIVATPEDFGFQGELPSHPELLDWLAIEFVDRNWDVKAMMKLIVTSATYRQASSSSFNRSNSSYKSDPYNVLLSRGPRFRVSAEEVRDIALAASGRLTPTLGGPSVFPPQPPGVWENSFTFYDTKDRWVDDDGPNRYRRGLYTYWRRTAPFPMALTFDLKSRDMCVPRRSRTNTPLQALSTLNDPLFVECAGMLGKTMCAKADAARAKSGAPYGTRASLDRYDDEGLDYGFRASTGRKPKGSELAAMRRLLIESRSKFARDGESATKLLRAARLAEKEELTTENAAWTVVANALLNLDETLTKG